MSGEHWDRIALLSYAISILNFWQGFVLREENVKLVIANYERATLTHFLFSTRQMENTVNHVRIRKFS